MPFPLIRLVLQPRLGYFGLPFCLAITKIGNRGIGESGNRGVGESGNRGIGEYGNGKRYRYAVCGIITNYQIQVYSQKVKGIPHGI